MLVSTKGRYALSVMIDLAEHNSGEFIPLVDIADRQDISKVLGEYCIKAESCRLGGISSW